MGNNNRNGASNAAGAGMKTRNKGSRQTMNGLLNPRGDDQPPSSRDRDRDNGSENIPPRVAQIKKDTVGKAGGQGMTAAGGKINVQY